MQDDADGYERTDGRDVESRIGVAEQFCAVVVRRDVADERLRHDKTGGTATIEEKAVEQKPCDGQMFAVRRDERARCDHDGGAVAADPEIRLCLSRADLPCAHDAEWKHQVAEEKHRADDGDDGVGGFKFGREEHDNRFAEAHVGCAVDHAVTAIVQLGGFSLFFG